MEQSGLKTTYFVTEQNTPIWRLVKKGAKCVCGICRREYDNEANAKRCFASCGGQFLSQAPVLTVLQGTGQAHLCRFCGRKYGKVDDAQLCATECSSKARAKYNACVTGTALVMPLPSVSHVTPIVSGAPIVQASQVVASLGVAAHVRNIVGSTSSHILAHSLADSFAGARDPGEIDIYVLPTPSIK